MEIHSSSLRTPPVKIDNSQAPKVSAVHRLPRYAGGSSPYKDSSSAKPQSTAEVETLLARVGKDFYETPFVQGVLDDCLPTKVQHALSAYQGERDKPLQNQRAALIMGIDFYA